MNIADTFTENARKRPGHPAVEDDKRIVSYGELEVLANTVAANLLAEGVEPGDIVGLMLPDSVEHVALFWALARIGAVIFPINAKLLRSDREVGLGGRQLKAVIADGDFPSLPSGTRVILLGTICAKPPDAAMPVTPAAPGDRCPLACVQSSGTTGAPKTFMASHAQVIGSLHINGKSIPWTSVDRYIAIIGMGFYSGCRLCFLALFFGSTIVVNRARSVEEIVRLVQEKRITKISLAPIHLRPLLDYAVGKPLLFPLLRSMSVASSAVTPRERLLARKHLTPNFFEVYGANELSLIAIATPADQDAQPDSVGRPVEGVEAQVVDGDHQPLPFGGVGLIRLRSDCAATGYLNDPEANARAFRDGWFYPMDLAAINEDGYVFLKGRADDVINNDGIKFYPIEVENVLLSHPKVSEAAVFGWPHELHGEIAVAAVVASAPVSYRDLVAFSQSRLANYKIPWTILFMPRMPRNPMGKILKTKLKDMMRQKLAKQSLRQRVRTGPRAGD